MGLTEKPRTIDIYPTKPEGKVEMGIYEWNGADELRGSLQKPSGLEFS